MYYERKIKYLDYYEEGEKLRGGGFVKLEIKEDKFWLEISVKGLHPTDSFVRDVILRSGGTEAALGQITIRDGCGSFVYSCDVDKEMGHTGIAYAALREIRIPIGGTRELICPLAEAARSYREQAPVSREGTSPVSVEESAEKVMKAVEVSKAVEVTETAEVIKKVEVQKVEEAAKVAEIIEKDVESKGIGEKQRVETQQFPEVHKPSTEELQQQEISDATQSQQKERVSDTRQSLQNPQQREDASTPQTLLSEVHLASAEPDMLQGARHKERWERGQENKQEGNSEGKSDSKPVGKPGNKTQSSPESSSEGSPEGSHSAKKGKTAPRLLEDKWQQLSAIYPHIQPFQDERDYLSINPSDFVLFPSKFYKAVNNSFLLHGYYNYNHLILARIEHRGEVIYYIGVPGNYYDREKQVAVMFGFESFECASEPAKTGDFGYYMMRMEL